MTPVLRIPIDFPRNPTTVQAEQLFRELSEITGVKISGVKVSGFWLIYRDGQIMTSSPTNGRPNVRSFDKAIATVAGDLGVTVCRAVPFKK